MAHPYEGRDLAYIKKFGRASRLDRQIKKVRLEKVTPGGALRIAGVEGLFKPVTSGDWAGKYEAQETGDRWSRVRHCLELWTEEHDAELAAARRLSAYRSAMTLLEEWAREAYRAKECSQEQLDKVRQAFELLGIPKKTPENSA